MSIQWGCDLSGLGQLALVPTGNADVTCTAGAFVSCLSVGGTGAAAVQATNQDFIPIIQGVMTFVLGGTAPTALAIIFATTAGTAIDTYTVEPGLLVNSAELVIPIFLVGVSSSVLFGGSGATPLIQVKATTTACTMKAVGSRAFLGLALGV